MNKKLHRLLCMLIIVLCVLGCRDEVEPDAVRARDFDLGVSSARPQPVSFVAEVMSIVPAKNPHKGIFIGDKPEWTVELKILSVGDHPSGTSFRPYDGEYHIANTESVFGASREDVSGRYQFTYAGPFVDGNGRVNFIEFSAKKSE